MRYIARLINYLNLQASKHPKLVAVLSTVCIAFPLISKEYRRELIEIIRSCTYYHLFYNIYLYILTLFVIE